MREPIFSVTRSDCRWDYYRGSGKGGQKRNKTSSAVRCTHVASGARGQSEDTRSQTRNKQIAFGRMAQTNEFKRWLEKEAARLAPIGAPAEVPPPPGRYIRTYVMDGSRQTARDARTGTERPVREILDGKLDLFLP